MNLTDVKKKAEALGINSSRMKGMKKAEIIRATQSAEGYTACYASRSSGCPEESRCCYAADCYKDAAGGADSGESRPKSAKASKGK